MRKNVTEDLQYLTQTLKHRPMGSKENQAAAGYIKAQFEKNGLTVQTASFPCKYWIPGKIQLSVSDMPLKAQISPYSLPYKGKGKFVTVENLEQLKEKNYTDQLLVMHGEIAQSQLMPKNFTFYNPPEHQEIIGILEQKKPCAIIAITSFDPQMAAALNPPPLFEDGDFDIPSVYLSQQEGEKLIQQPDGIIHLAFGSNRIDSTGMNVCGQIGDPTSQKIVITAHLDTKPQTPGALDNATGLALLLDLSHRLKHYQGPYFIELVAINGEDDYAQSGQMEYIKHMDGPIFLAINCDGVGFYKGNTSISHFNTSEAIRSFFQKQTHLIEKDPWYQGDHMLFVMNEIPALAFTSESLDEILTQIAHTPKDTIKIVDVRKITELSSCLSDFLDFLT